jgi:hypothetical protein
MANATWPWLALVLAVGAIVRLAAVIGAPMPVGDGGFVASAIDDLRSAGFVLPMFASYNGGDIPFAYPPLAFYLGAVLPWSPLATLQWVPALLAAATIVPTAIVARRVAGETAAVTAAAYLAVAPFAWYWLVQGGGLTRALALLLGMSAVATAVHRRGVLTGALGGLTALAHPETGIFAAVVVGVFLAANRAWRPLTAAITVSVLMVLPWLVLVVSRHGIDPILAAAGARSVNPVAAVLSISGDRPGALDLAAAVGLIGLVASGVRWLWVATALVAVLLTTSLATHMAPLLALGTGVTVARAQIPRRILATAAALLVLGAAVTTGNPQPLGSDDRAAMDWIVAETPREARFAVLSDEVWSRSDEAEWLPYLTDRISVTTLQGREWLPDWQAIDARSDQLVACRDIACIRAWARESPVEFLYLADGCCLHLDSTLQRNQAFRMGSAAVYRLDLGN